MNSYRHVFLFTYFPYSHHIYSQSLQRFHLSACHCTATDCTVCSGNLIWWHLWPVPASVQYSGGADWCRLAEEALHIHKTCVNYDLKYQFQTRLRLEDLCAVHIIIFFNFIIFFQTNLMFCSIYIYIYLCWVLKGKKIDIKAFVQQSCCVYSCFLRCWDDDEMFFMESILQ